MEWGVYGRKFFVKDVDGSKITDFLYSFINVYRFVKGSTEWESYKSKFPKGSYSLSRLEDYEKRVDLVEENQKVIYICGFRQM